MSQVEDGELIEAMRWETPRAGSQDGSESRFCASSPSVCVNSIEDPHHVCLAVVVAECMEKQLPFQRTDGATFISVNQVEDSGHLEEICMSGFVNTCACTCLPARSL